MSKWLLGVGALAVLLGGAGCTPPKVVTQITGARNQLKFLIVQGNRQQVVKCQMGADGVLSDCKQMQLVLQDDD